MKKSIILGAIVLILIFFTFFYFSAGEISAECRQPTLEMSWFNGKHIMQIIWYPDICNYKITKCISGWGDCNADSYDGWANGCETNLKTDSNNCGSCKKKCQPGKKCANGACVPVKPPADAKKVVKSDVKKK